MDGPSSAHHLTSSYSEGVTERIFIQIQSYRNAELPLTIQSALDYAADPGRLRFGICWQYDEWTHADLEPYVDDDRFSINEVYYRYSKGRAWARAQANEAFAGEPYFLQIEARTRFDLAWDTRLIEMLESTDSPRPILTTYPPPYKTREDGEVIMSVDTGVQRLVLDRLRPDLTVRLRGELAPSTAAPGPCQFIADGFLFSRGQFCVEVPPDPGIGLDAEEIATTVRAFTHGWDIYYPNENVVWRGYDNPAPLPPDSDGRDRLATLLLGDASTLEPYGLGTARSVAEYERWANVDFAAVSHKDLTYRIVIGVFTCEHYVDRREACEKTWIADFASDPDVLIVFLRGDETLASPHSLEGSTLWCRCPDDYLNLAFKTREFARWAAENIEFEYLFRCDDDTYVYRDLFVAYDQNGVDYIGTPVRREFASGGAGYFLSPRAAELVADADFEAKTEDRQVGELLAACGIDLTVDSCFRGWTDDWDDETDLPTQAHRAEWVTSHLGRKPPEKMYELHAAVERDRHSAAVHNG
jgi:hypothetical protein